MEDKVKTVVLAGREDVLLRQAYPAFAAAGLSVFAIAGSVEELQGALAALDQPAVCVVEADIYPTVQEAMEGLGSLPIPWIVLLPAHWAGHQEAFGSRPGFLGGHIQPVTWAQVAAGVKMAWPRNLQPQPRSTSAPSPTPPVPPTSPPAPVTASAAVAGAAPSIPLPRPSMTKWLGFVGQRGGAGTTTTAVRAAQVLAAQGKKVALWDVWGRGDAGLLLRGAGGVTLIEGQVEAGEFAGFDVVVMDSGRKRVDTDAVAQWFTVKNTWPEERVYRSLGLTPPQPTTQPATPSGDRGRRDQRPAASTWLRRLPLSIEFTD